MRTLALLMIAALVVGWHVDCPCPADAAEVCPVCVAAADTCAAHHGGDECIATRSTPPTITIVAVLRHAELLPQPLIPSTDTVPLTAAPLHSGPVLGSPSDRAPPVS